MSVSGGTWGDRCTTPTNNNNQVVIDINKFADFIRNAPLPQPQNERKPFKPNRVQTIVPKQPKVVGKKSGKPNKQKFGKNKKDNRSQRGVNLDEDSVVYRGPIHLPESNEEAQIQIFNVSYTSEQALTAGEGTFVFATGLVRSIADWSDIEVTWHEYRVLGMEWTFVPYKCFQMQTIADDAPGIWAVLPAVSCVDRAAGAALASYAGGAQHESAKFFQTDKIHHRTIKMDGVEEAVWTATNTTFSWGWIKMYTNLSTLTTWENGANAFSATQPLGRSFFTFLVEVRGRS